MLGVTENKDSNASERWMKISHFLTALKQHLDLKMQRGQINRHTEFDTIRLKKDEDHVKRVVAGLKLLVSDMWKKEQPLVKVCDGTITSDQMARNILSATKVGKKCHDQVFYNNNHCSC